MRIVSVSMVRNEEDVLEAFVRHHAPLVDLMLIVDHTSVDRSPEILELLAEEGLPVSIRTEPSLVQRQWQVVTSLMREAATLHGADWVVALDADEFLVPADRDRVERALAGLPDGAPARIGLRSYVPTLADDATCLNPVERIVHRRESEGTQYWKALVPAAIAGDERFALTQGNHAVRDAERPVDSQLAEGLSLAHFPVRSAEQVTRKVLGGWLAHVARPDRRDSEAFQWKRVFDELVSGLPVSETELEEVALDYSVRDPESDVARALVADPVPAAFALRYTQSLSTGPLAVLAATAEALVAELSESAR